MIEKMFDKLNYLAKLKKENEELKQENENLKDEISRLNAKQKHYDSIMYRCEKMKDDLRKSIFEARKAQGNYNTLYKQLIKFVEN